MLFKKNKEEYVAQSKQDTIPIALLNIVLLVEFVFVAVMMITMVYSEQQVRTSMERQVRLERLQGDILHLDEVLTMSARMSAASGDLQWEERYKKFEPKLEATIQEALKLLPSDKLEGLEETNDANEKLVELEKAAFAAVRNGDTNTAQKLLSSPLYEQEKINYALGMKQRLSLLDSLVDKLIQAQKNQVKRIQILGLIGWALLIAVWFLVIKGIRSWQQILSKTRNELEQSQKLLQKRVYAMAREVTHVEQKERERISKMLHDQLQQILVAARLHLHLLPQSEERQKTEQLIDEAIIETRSLTTRLNPPALMIGGLQSALEWLIERMNEKYHIKIHLVTPESFPELEKEIQIVAFDSIRELLFNVVKHAQVNHAYLECKATGNKVQFIVRDEGVGFNVNDTISNNRFGLLNTLRRVELVGGVVDIRTQPNKGCFTQLEFPIKSAAEVISSIRILLVDDHVIVREGIRAVINKEEDLKVVGEASNLVETLTAVQKLNPDVIIMDMSLGPETPSGLDIIRELRRREFFQSVIVLTSYDLPHFKSVQRELQIQEYLIKGEDTQKLIMAIRSGISKEERRTGT